MNPFLKTYSPADCREVLPVILLCSLFVPGSIYSQNRSANTAAKSPEATTGFYTTPAHLNTAIRGSENYDTIFWMYKGLCKATGAGKRIVPPSMNLEADGIRPMQSESKHRPLLRIHGSVEYSFLYRSFVDTPFSQNDFQQHTVQTYLSILVKDKYPINLRFSRRISNSPYFRNFLDINMQFDQRAYLRQAKEKALERIAGSHFQNASLAHVENILENALNEYNKIDNWLKNSNLLQRITEEREKQVIKLRSRGHEIETSPINIEDLGYSRKYKMKGTGLVKDAVQNGFDSSVLLNVRSKKKELDSLATIITAIKERSDSIKKNIQGKLNMVRQKVYKASTLRELEQIESQAGVEAQKKRPFDKFLSNIKSVGIGRSVINYSELTAWNVSLTGFNMEYNPGIYTAIAAGKIDYGFRDFLGRNSRQKGQTFVMGRIGLGDVQRKAIILSAFGGKKYSYGSMLSDSISNHVQVAGYSLEGIWKKDENTAISVELAKTTIPVGGRFRDNNGMKNLFGFDDNSNLGISIKAQTLITQVGTRLSGFYRKTGENFQSFSLFTYNTDQTAWLLKMEQPFFKERINITGMLRRNDFTNPFSEKTFKTSTVFKSVQVNMRLPKWPVISAGFYPGSQLYIIDRERIREHAYYIVNASVMHNYNVSGIRMLSSAIYNRYSAKGTDSGFIAYAGVNYMASHAFILRKAQLQAIYIFTDQEQMQYYTLEASGDYSLNSRVRLGAGLKHNKISGGYTYIGGRAHVAVEVRKLGGLQLHYEKSYLPTIRRTLFPVESGRLVWFKYF